MSHPFPIRIGLIGAGTVGCGVYDLLASHAEHHRKALGLELSIVAAGCRNLDRVRPIPRSLLTHDLESIIANDGVDIVVEAAGGVHPFLDLLTNALRFGKPVVTANKELVAKHGHHLLNEAYLAGRDFRFEACVCGGVPVIGALTTLTAANTPLRFRGILNGSTNQMLTLMDRDDMDFGDALAFCQSKGYLEADPSADLDGFDAAYKLALLASVVLRRPVDWTSVERTGIRNVDSQQIQEAHNRGEVIKLVASADFSTPSPLLRVKPEGLPMKDPLSQVDDALNAVTFESNPLGSVTWVGPGAGAGPTASALIGDVITIATQLRHGVQPYAVTWN